MRRVMILDDDAAIRALLVDVLRAEAYVVTEASDGLDDSVGVGVAETLADGRPAAEIQRARIHVQAVRHRDIPIREPFLANVLVHAQMLGRQQAQGTEHALSQFEATSPDACDGFLTNLVRIAKYDAITRASSQGRLPLERPR